MRDTGNERSGRYNQDPMIGVLIATGTLSVLYPLEVEVMESDAEKIECIWGTEGINGLRVTVIMYEMTLIGEMAPGCGK